MDRPLIAVAIFLLTCSLGISAETTSQTASLGSQLSPRDARSLIAVAHSAAQYKQLAGYYRAQEAKYRAEAASEKAERDRRTQVNAPVMQKYPRPVDSSQYRYESLSSSADRASLEAQHYEQLAAAQTQHGDRAATTVPGK
jgi:hypothetical protein